MRIDERTSLSLLGPQGVKQRMDELQRRLDQLSPQPKSAFQGLLEQNMPGPMAFEGSPLPASTAAAISLKGEIGYAPYNPFSSGASLSCTPELKGLIAKAATDNGLEPELLDAVVQAESNYNPGAVSRAGARGLTQLMPNTAVQLGVKNIFDPAENLYGGAKYLAQQIREFGNLRDALAAYNAGPSRVARGGTLPLETSLYVDKVLRLYEENKSR